LKRPLLGGNRSEKTGLTRPPVIQNKDQETLRQHWHGHCPPCPGCYSDHRREWRKRCVGDRKLSEMMVAMSFIARWMKIS